jgi:hypothetical protein
MNILMEKKHVAMNILKEKKPLTTNILKKMNRSVVHVD